MFRLISASTGCSLALEHLSFYHPGFDEWLLFQAHGNLQTFFRSNSAQRLAIKAFGTKDVNAQPHQQPERKRLSSVRELLQKTKPVTAGLAVFQEKPTPKQLLCNLQDIEALLETLQTVTGSASGIHEVSFFPECVLFLCMSLVY